VIQYCKLLNINLDNNKLCNKNKGQVMENLLADSKLNNGSLSDDWQNTLVKLLIN